MATQPHVLDLDTFDDRPRVRIGKKEYRLWTIDLLPPIDNHRIRKLLKRNDELALQEDLSAADTKELKAIYYEVCRTVVDAPDAIHKKLTDKQRSEIIRTFQEPLIELLMKMLAAAPTETTESALPPTGEKPPVDSAGSTQP